MTALGLYNGKALLRCNTAGAPHVATKQLEMYFATKQLEMCFPSHAPLARGKKWHSPKTCTCITSCKTLEDDSLKLYIEAGAGRRWLPVSARRRVRVQDVQRQYVYSLCSKQQHASIEHGIILQRLLRRALPPAVLFHRCEANGQAATVGARIIDHDPAAEVEIEDEEEGGGGGENGARDNVLPRA